MIINNYIYYNKENNFIIITFVNNFLIVGPKSKFMNKVKKELYKQFEIKEMRPLKYFLDIQIIQDRKNCKIYLYQDIYIKKILEKYRMTNYKVADMLINTETKEWLVLYKG